MYLTSQMKQISLQIKVGLNNDMQVSKSKQTISLVENRIFICGKDRHPK